MIKGLFVFSGIVYEKDNKYYTVKMTSEVFHKLYFPYCTKLIVCERIKHTTEVTGLTEVRSDDIDYMCPPYSPSSYSMYFINRRKYFKFIENLVKQVDFVVERPGILGCAASKYAAKYKKPCICEVTGNYFDVFWYHSLSGKLLAPFRYLDAKKTVRNSKYTIYVTQQYLQSKFPSEGISVGISDVEIAKMGDVVLKERIEKINAYSDSTVYKMATIASVDAKLKGLIYALKAIKRLQRKGLQVIYYLIGEGNQTYLKTKALKYGISNQIVFTGSMPHNDVYDFLSEMDLYIQPSVTEGLPRAVVEAMSRALPCLGTNIGGIPELIPSEMLFKKKSVNQICSIIEGLTKNSLKKYATISFNRAKEFEQEKLKKKRDEFFNVFLRENNITNK